MGNWQPPSQFLNIKNECIWGMYGKICIFTSKIEFFHGNRAVFVLISPGTDVLHLSEM